MRGRLCIMYWSINNTPYLAKVLEKTAFYQINDHLINNHLYCTNQSGYKQNHSCETALIRIVNNIQETIFNNNLAVVLMLDLSAAFDTVDHQRLLFKLQENLNITGKDLGGEFGLTIHSYADDTTLYIGFNPTLILRCMRKSTRLLE